MQERKGIIGRQSDNIGNGMLSRRKQRQEPEDSRRVTRWGYAKGMLSAGMDVTVIERGGGGQKGISGRGSHAGAWILNASRAKRTPSSLRERDVSGRGGMRGTSPCQHARVACVLLLHYVTYKEYSMKITIYLIPYIPSRTWVGDEQSSNH